MDNIINRKLVEGANDYAASITAFYNTHKADTVKGCKPVATESLSANVTPGVIKALTDNINDLIKAEKEQFINISTKINDITTNVK
jgi:hypothetical protein